MVTSLNTLADNLALAVLTSYVVHIAETRYCEDQATREEAVYSATGGMSARIDEHVMNMAGY